MSFTDGLNKFIKTTHDTAVRAVKSVIDEAIEDLTEFTPEDSGTAAANWNSSERVVTTFRPESKSPAGNELVQKSRHGRLSKRFVDMSSDIYVSNPTPYILRLERGSSDQAPLGMVERTISRIKSRRSV